MKEVSRKEYLRYREAGSRNSLQTIYLYYQDAAEEQVDPIFFSQAFPMWCQKTYTNPYQDIMRYTLHSLDNKYEVVKLEDTSGKLIKIL